MPYLTKNREEALASTIQALRNRDVSIENCIGFLLQAIKKDPSLDQPRVELYRVLHQTDIRKNLDNPNAAAHVERYFPRPNAPLPPGAGAILEKLRAFLSAIETESVLKGSPIAPHWAEKQRIARGLALNLSDPRNIIQLAQSRLCGFDHRAVAENYRDIIRAKAALLQSAFGVDPLALPELSDSPHSVAHSLMNIMGRFVSSSTLWHAGFLMRVLDKIDLPSLRVLEIGGGYGGLAMLFRNSGRCRQHVIVDLPEALIYAYTFLTLTFEKADIRLCESANDVVQSGDEAFVLVPAQFAENLAEQEFDLALNTGSFQEMTAPATRNYLDLLQNKIRVKYLYSMNYIFEDKGNNPETRAMAGSESNLASPEIDPFWEVEYFEINPPHFTIDSPRNWAEILLRRIKIAERVSRPTEEVLREIDLQEFGTQAWFERVWIALWRQPNRRLVDRYLTGIEGFVRGTTSVKDPLLKMRGSVDRFDTIGEVLYWRRRRETLPE